MVFFVQEFLIFFFSAMAKGGKYRFVKRNLKENGRKIENMEQALKNWKMGEWKGRWALSIKMNLLFAYLIFYILRNAVFSLFSAMLVSKWPSGQIVCQKTLSSASAVQIP